MTKNFRYLEISFLGLAIVGVCIAGGACSTSDAASPTAGAGGTTATHGGTSSGGTNVTPGGTSAGGSTPIAGSSSVAGSGGAAPLTGCGDAPACPKATMASLLTFDLNDAGVASTGFGDFTTTFSGFTFVFPAVTDVPAPMYPITTDTSGANYHMTGMIGTYSAFVVGFNQCAKVDASMFTGISFTISGHVDAPPGVNSVPNTLQLSIAQAADAVSSVWINANKAAGAADVAANAGCCTPTAMPPNQYDGTCAAPGFVVPVTATPTTVTVHWTDLTPGKPVAALDPSQIEGLVWAFPAPPGAGTTTATPYAADVIIDDIAFVP